MVRRRRIEVCVNDGEMEGIKRLAERSGLKVATWIRALVIREVHRKTEEPF